MLFRLYAISIMLLIVLQSTVGAHGTTGMLCLGGDDLQTMNLACDSGCGHESMPMPSHSHDHGHECGCVDIALTFADLRVQQRDDAGLLFAGITTPIDDWRSIALVSSACATGPPDLHDPAYTIDATLRVVHSTRLLI